MEEIQDVKTWLKQWFPLIEEAVQVNQGSGNASKNLVTDTGGAVTLENKVSAGSGLSLSNTNEMSHSNSVTALTTAGLKKIKHDVNGHITETANPDTTDLLNSETYANIGTSLTNQKLVNDGVNTKLGSLQTAVDNLIGKEFLKVDTADSQGNPATTPSANTMNAIYLVKAGSGLEDNYNEFITVRSGTEGSYTYAWEKIGTTSLDLSNYVQKSSTNGLIKNDGTIMTSGSGQDNYATGSHIHGQISRTGTITNTAVGMADSASNGDFIVITDTSDSDKIKRTGSIWARYVLDATAHSNIGSSSNASQKSINNSINTALGNRELTSNKTTSISDVSTDTQYPSAKAVYSFKTGTFTELATLISNATAGSTIVLDKDYKNTGSETGITISKSLKIVGNGHIIDANNTSGFFKVQDGNSSYDLSLEDIVFLNGNCYEANWYGDIEFISADTLSIVDCSFINCRNGYDSDGTWVPNGDVIAFESNNFTCRGCSFIKNTVGYASIWAGSISSPDIRECHFRDNINSNDDEANVKSDASDPIIIYNCRVSDSTLNNAVNRDYAVAGSYVTGISLAPKGTDSSAPEYNGVIRLWYGDERTVTITYKLNGTATSGVNITLDGVTKTTNSSGKATFKYVSDGTYTVHYGSSGTQSITVSSSATSFTINDT